MPITDGGEGAGTEGSDAPPDEPQQSLWRALIGLQAVGVLLLVMLGLSSHHPWLKVALAVLGPPYVMLWAVCTPLLLMVIVVEGVTRR